MVITKSLKLWERFCALSLCLATPFVSRADFAMTNPVTGETENYTWKFVGTDTWNNTNYWQNSSGAHPSGVPAKSGENTWTPILFDGYAININASMSVEGWNLRMGLYNGANVTMNTFVKLQGGTTMWMTVDESSQLTINGFSGGNMTDGQKVKLSVAKQNGIRWNTEFKSVNANNTYEYYLKGEGSVYYEKVSAASHKIKMADITLSGVGKEVKSKTLVTLGDTSTVTFTADATIKRLDSSGADLDNDCLLASVNTTGTTTLTTSDAVGTCELVQTSTGIELYWVDGDPAEMVEKTYKPSISVNFTTGTSLSTAADVGISEYAIPGTSWNNLIGNNGSLTTVTGVDSAGAASTIPGAKVTISGTRGYWRYDDNSGATTLYNGYIDDRNNGSDTPTVVIEGITYHSYKLVVYFSNDTDGVNFGYITVNGDNYKGSDGSTVTCEGTSSDKWGAANHSAWTEGGNYLVTPTIFNENGKLTLISHDLAGCRAGIAAIQIVDTYDPSATDYRVIGDGETLVLDEELTGMLRIGCDGSFTITGTAGYTATDSDFIKLVLDDVTGSVTLGADTCYDISETRMLPEGFQFGEGSAVAITETCVEYAKDVFSVEGLTGVSSVKLARFDGTTVTLVVTDGVATRGDGTDVKVFGSAALYDFTFTNTLSTAYGSRNTATLGQDADPVYDESADGVGVNASPALPYIRLDASMPNWAQFSTVVVAKMPSAAKKGMISFGWGWSNMLFLATGDNKDEVIVGYGNNSSVETLAKMTVPQASDSRHLYAFVVSEDRTKMTIYLDGIKWRTVTKSDGFTFGTTSGGSGIQIGKGIATNPAGYDSATDGVFYSLLIYDYVISDTQIAALKDVYPYSPAGGSYSREVSGETTFETETATWTKGGDETPEYTVPANGAAVTLTVTDDAVVTVDTILATDSLTLGGNGSITLKKGSGKLTSEGLTTIATDVTIEMGAVDISGAPTIFTEGGSITFDCRSIDVSSIYETTVYALTGQLAAEDLAKVTVQIPDGDSYRMVAAEYKNNGYVVTVTPDHEAGSEVYYKQGYWGETDKPADVFSVTNASGATTIVFPGDTVVVPAYSDGASAYVGSPLPANVYAIRIDKDFTFSGGNTGGAAILSNAVVTVAENCTLTIQRNWNNIVLGSVEFNGSGVVLDSNNGTITVSGAVAGTSTLTVKENKSVTVEATGSVANAIVLEDGATLTVKDGATIPEEQPTTSVADSYISTYFGDGETVYSVEHNPPAFEPIAPSEGGSATYDDAAAATSAAAAINADKDSLITLPTEMTTEQKATYLSYVEAKATGNKVDIVFSTDGETALQEAVDAEASDFAEAAIEAAADAVNGGTAEIATTPGLYYVVEAGSDVDGIVPASCTLATGTSLELTIPNKGEKGFYQLRVSTVPVTVTP